MDSPLAFAVQDVPSEVIAFSLFTTRWAEEHTDEVKSWIQPRREIIAPII
jgi:hypothetical protein